MWKSMRCHGKSFITKGVIWDSLASYEIVHSGFTKKRLIILLSIFCLAVQMRA
jgi:hypothetical protein